MKKYVIAFVACLPMVLFAQTKTFEQYKQEQQAKYQQYKSDKQKELDAYWQKINAEYAAKQLEQQGLYHL